MCRNTRSAWRAAIAALWQYIKSAQARQILCDGI